MTLFGLSLIDLVVIAGYFGVMLLIGFWASGKVKNDEDFYLGGRRFGKGLLMMHWLCTGTHSEMAVQVAGATARVGLGGIWYQWMWLFSTPFYWLVAPVIRRLRVITTGDFFRVRYGRSLEIAYAMVGLTYLVLSIALLLRGAGAAIAGATGGAIPTQSSVLILSIMFSTYVVAGGLVAAAYTDYVQGIMIIVLSVMLVPIGLSRIGGVAALGRNLPAEMLSITAPAHAAEGNIGFVIAMSLVGLTGVVAQPHVMNATGSGKTELEARIGMCYGNFIKRILTIAWSFTGLIAVVMFADVLSAVEPNSEAAKAASETLFGLALRDLLGDGWRGLMIACLIAGVTSAETFIVVGSGLFTRNVYRHFVSQANDRHYLWVGRVACALVLAVSIIVASVAGSVTQLVWWSLEVIALLGAAFWLGVVWRRVNTIAVWSSLMVTLTVLALIKLDDLEWFATILKLRGHSRPVEIMISLAAQFGVLVIVSLSTRPQRDVDLDPFFARLLTPVGKESEVAREKTSSDDDRHALGLHGMVLDYQQASKYGYPGLRRWGWEIPRFGWIDGGGFAVAWGIVGGLILLLVWLADLAK